MGRSRKPLWVCAHRGFKSHPFRHNNFVVNVVDNGDVACRAMSTKKSLLRKALVAAVSGALVLPVFALTSPASAATPVIEKPWSSTFLVGGSAPVHGLYTRNWGAKKVLVAVGAVVTGSSSAKAYLRVDNFNFSDSDYGWGFNSDLETQKASNNGAGLETLQFYGTEPLVNAILARLTVTTTAGTTGVQIKTMATEYKEGLIYFPQDEHFYRFVKPLKADGTLNDKLKWSEAKAAAEATTEFGQTGYLATVTSAQENEFVTTRISPDGLNAARNVWLGGVVADTNYDWKWAAGPEKDTVFYKGCESDNTRTGSSATYHAFSAGEPNNYFSANDKCSTTTITEGCLLTNNRESRLLGEWNDFPCDLAGSYPKSEGYVIEYGNKPTGGDFVGVYRLSSQLSRAVPPTQPTLLETLAKVPNKIKSKVLSTVQVLKGKKSALRKTVESKPVLKNVKKGEYALYVRAQLPDGRVSGLTLRPGSSVNGIAFKGNSFTLKKDTKTLKFNIVVRATKQGVQSPTFWLIKRDCFGDGSGRPCSQSIPSNWKIALKQVN
jgi:hypothetical protein